MFYCICIVFTLWIWINFCWNNNIIQMQCHTCARFCPFCWLGNQLIFIICVIRKENNYSVVCLDGGSVNGSSERSYFTFHSQNCATYKCQFVYFSSLTEVCCVVLFPNVVDGKNIQRILFCDCKSRVHKLSFQWYFLKCSCCNSLEHISRLKFIPVKQTSSIPRVWTCQSHVITSLSHNYMELVGKVWCVSPGCWEQTNTVISRQSLKNKNDIAREQTDFMTIVSCGVKF